MLLGAIWCIVILTGHQVRQRPKSRLRSAGWRNFIQGHARFGKHYEPGDVYSVYYTEVSEREVLSAELISRAK